MVQGRDRRVELGYQWAIELRKNIIYPPKNKNSKFNPAPGNYYVKFLYDSSSFRTLVIDHNLGNRMLGQARPNSITQVMIYNLGYDL